MMTCAKDTRRYIIKKKVTTTYNIASLQIKSLQHLAGTTRRSSSAAIRNIYKYGYTFIRIYDTPAACARTSLRKQLRQHCACAHSIRFTTTQERNRTQQPSVIVCLLAGSGCVQKKCARSVQSVSAVWRSLSYIS